MKRVCKLTGKSFCGLENRMARKKLQKFEEFKTMQRCYDPSQESYKNMAGKWQKTVFKNDNPIVLELACGYGEYTVGLAEIYPNKNFIGVDIKADRMWKGATLSTEKKINNTAFLRTQIQQLANFFQEGEISDIWITFADPQPNKERARLTSKRFLDIYKKILKKDGTVHLKTDSSILFDYTLKTLKSRNDIRDLKHTNDLYTSVFANIHHGIKTRYEKHFTNLGEVIKYLQFRFKHTKK